MRKKPIPKFLHKHKKTFIGKKLAFSNNFQRDDVLGLEVDMIRHWTERVTVEQRVEYQWEQRMTIESLLEHAGTVSEFHEAINEHDYEQAQALIAHAVEVYEDYMSEEGYSWGEEVGRESLDEDFEETVDSGSQVDFTFSRQADNVQQGLNSVPRLQGLSYWYEYVASWMMGLRSLPYSEYIILQHEGHNNE